MKRRASGILLHVTSLPSRFGIGDLGPEAYRFVDFLSQTKQSYWQILPVTPTDPASGNSPYSSISAMAGNPLFISPELLVDGGLLTEHDIAEPPPFPVERCDYASVIPYRMGLLNRAYDRFRVAPREEGLFDAFCADNAYWLDDFALFVVVKRQHGERGWWEWEPGLWDRDGTAIERATREFRDDIEREKFQQYIFSRQWAAVKDYAGEHGVSLIGDIPIYVNCDSADVWTHRELFNLDAKGCPLTVAGVPPDYFSETGQRWGNPHYRWEMLRETQYDWWVKRIGHTMRLVDFIRIDHFRGFVGYWEVPVSEETAVNGRWVEAPAMDFFTHLSGKFPYLPVIAEDLGIITDDVRDVMARFDLPGMRVLQFAFNDDSPGQPFLPHNYVPNCIAYTGTHDNNTTRGWFEGEASAEARSRFFRYLGHELIAEHAPIEFIRLIMMSVADTVILPMQDVLALGASARMNTPSTITGNWEWRLDPALVTPDVSGMLGEMTEIYGR